MKMVTGLKNCSSTRIIGDLIGPLINSTYSEALDFFNKSFFETDQLSNTIQLEWDNKHGDEIFKHIPTAFLSNKALQGHVELLDEEDQEEKEVKNQVIT